MKHRIYTITGIIIVISFAAITVFTSWQHYRKKDEALVKLLEESYRMSEALYNKRFSDIDIAYQQQPHKVIDVKTEAEKIKRQHHKVILKIDSMISGFRSGKGNRGDAGAIASELKILYEIPVSSFRQNAFSIYYNQQVLPALKKNASSLVIDSLANGFSASTLSDLYFVKYSVSAFSLSCTDRFFGMIESDSIF